MLKVEVVPVNSTYLVIQQRNFSLNKSDIENVSHFTHLLLLQVFKIFGELKEVVIELVQGYALVTFSDIMSAFFA